MGYFTVEVKPTIPNVAAGQHTAFGQNDLLFDWYAFDVPSGTCRLIHIDQEIRPKGDSGSTVNEFDLDLLFAKANQDGTAPSSIGTVNSAALASAVNLSNNMMGFIVNGSWEAHEAHLDSTAYTQCREANCNMFFSNPGPQVTTKGYDRYYMAAIAEGAFDFVSSTLINNGDLNGPVLTVKGTDPRLFMAVGDTIGVTTTADTSVSKDMGVIKAIPSATTIVLESAFTTGDVVHEDIVYNQAPITFRLHFEY
jgi:hypothetical protein